MRRPPTPRTPQPAVRAAHAARSATGSVSIVASSSLEQSLAALLERHGYPVLSAAGTIMGGSTAIMDAKPEVMVLDTELPDGSGIEFCRQLTTTLPDLKVVLLCPTLTEEIEVAALAAGASAAVELSVSGASLLDALAAAIGEPGSRPGEGGTSAEAI
jgi:DNA-binding NarL/FixJ family response regulator